MTTNEKALAESVLKFYDSINSTNIFTPAQLRAWGEMIDQLNLVFPDQREIEACDHCGEETHQAGPAGDTISHCENCGCVEGYTHRKVVSE